MSRPMDGSALAGIDHHMKHMTSLLTTWYPWGKGVMRVGYWVCYADHAMGVKDTKPMHWYTYLM